MKKIYILLFLSFAFFRGFGQVAIGPEGGVVPLGAYPAYYNQYLKGGFKSGPDIASRDAYPVNLRDTQSFIFYTINDGTFWVLKGGITNEFWVKLDMGGTGGKTSSGPTFPTAPAAGEIFYHTTENRLFVFNGTGWIAVDNSLPEGQFYIGNESGAAVPAAKNTIPISGFDKAAADIAMGDGTANYKITNMADPTADQDAATKKYVDSKSSKTPAGSPLPGTASAGDMFYHTTENRLYLFNRTDWIPMDNSLPAGQLYVGNESGIAVPAAKNTIPISGFGKASADILMGDGTANYKISNLAQPANNQDAATKSYVDAAAASARDNLGNHTAAENLKLRTYSISSDGEAGKGLSFDADGNALFGQDVTVNNNVMTPSDQRLKTNIETLTGVLQKIGQMRGVSFEYVDQKKYAKGAKIGVIAQELQKVYPELVHKGSDGFFKVDYTQLTGILIQAVNEQQQEINELKSRMNKQQEQIDQILKTLKK